jgi:hypothetical protein
MMNVVAAIRVHFLFLSESSCRFFYYSLPDVDLNAFELKFFTLENIRKHEIDSLLSHTAMALHAHNCGVFELIVFEKFLLSLSA